METFDQVLAGESSGRVVLAEITSEGFQDSTSEIVAKAAAKGYSSIVITINNPSALLRKAYAGAGNDLSRVYFIDAITKYALGTSPEAQENTRYINQPGNLTDIGIELNKTLAELNGSKVCVIVDSINTMLIYVPSATLTKFIHFLSNKLRLLDDLGVYIIISGSIDVMFMNQLKSFADDFVEV